MPGNTDMHVLFTDMLTKSRGVDQKTIVTGFETLVLFFIPLHTHMQPIGVQVSTYNGTLPLNRLP